MRLVLSPVADACRWSLLLLSPLLSAQPRSSGGKLTRTAGPPGPGPRTGSGAAELRITRVFSRVQSPPKLHVRRLLLVAIVGYRWPFGDISGTWVRNA